MAKKKAKKSTPRTPRKKSAFDEFEANRLEGESAGKPTPLDDELADADFGDQDFGEPADVEDRAASSKRTERDRGDLDREPADEPRGARRQDRDDRGSDEEKDRFPRVRGEDFDDDDDDDDLDDELDDQFDAIDDDLDDDLDDRDRSRGAGRAGERGERKFESRDSASSDRSASDRAAGDRSSSEPPRRSDEGRRPSQRPPARRSEPPRGEPTRSEGYRRPPYSRPDDENAGGPRDRRNHRSSSSETTGERPATEGARPQNEDARDSRRPPRGRAEPPQDYGRRRPKGPPYRGEPSGDSRDDEGESRSPEGRGRFDDLESALDDAFDAFDDAPSQERDFSADSSRSEGDPMEPPPPPRVLEPDDETSLSALQKLGARLDVDADGHVWRVILFGQQSRDGALAHMRGLPALRDLWVIGTGVTKAGVEALKSEVPTIKVYA